MAYCEAIVGWLDLLQGPRQLQMLRTWRLLQSPYFVWKYTTETEKMKNAIVTQTDELVRQRKNVRPAVIVRDRPHPSSRLKTSVTVWPLGLR